MAEANKIGAATPYDFEGKNLTAYGGLLPVATMLEKLDFRRLVEETLRVKRMTRALNLYQFVLAMVLALYVGFSRLNHLRFLERQPMLVGILKVLRLPPQCTFWRFLASRHLQMAQQLLEVQRRIQPDALAKARIAYRDFLALWKDADPDIPILKQAKAEYARFQSSAPESVAYSSIEATIAAAQAAKMA